MATIDTNRTATFGRASSKGNFFTAMIAAVVAWNDARVTRTALNRLTDRELEDIGLCRGDIDAVARDL